MDNLKGAKKIVYAGELTFAAINLKKLATWSCLMWTQKAYLAGL
jgi:hypothetical protein